jgi:hypothetical protein
MSLGTEGVATSQAPRPETFALSCWLFLRLVACVSFVAFVSFGVQARGLLGDRGISPLRDSLAALDGAYAAARLWRAPTLFWLDASDASLLALCVAGALLSALLACGLVPRLVLALLWSAYLSLQTVGNVFLGYQWDGLLTEVLLASALLAPGGWRERLSEPREPARLPRWLLRLVLFKLMFLSGVVKLSSGDPTWRNLTALDFHYWTQPLPSWTSVYAAALPSQVQHASVVATLVVELLVPFLLFVPGRTRRWAALVTIAFQLAIAATGSYGFFNLLTIALCVLCLDDRTWLRALPRQFREYLARPGSPPTRPTPTARVVLTVAVGALAILNVLVTTQRLLPRHPLPSPLRTVLQLAAPWRSVNGYGLFAVMTTERPEILLEGSRDGTSWRPYEFRYKPGALERRPSFATPHQPRLDWQRWFAALRGCRPTSWFLRFSQRLLEGSPEVVALLDSDPFPEGPPRYLRSRLTRYRFAARHDRLRFGRWWERVGPETAFCPMLALDEGQLVIVGRRLYEP